MTSISWLALGIVLLCRCTGEEEPGPRGTVAPVFSDSSPDRAPAEGDSEPFDARNDEPASDVTDAEAPLELAAADCPELPLPANIDRLEALSALALTATRVYLATGTGLYVFNRAGGCAGALVMTLPHIAHALAPGTTDSVIASIPGSPGSVIVLNADGSEQSLCPGLTARSLDFVPELAIGYAAVLAGEIHRLELANPACSPQPIASIAATADVLAVAVERSTKGSLGALRRAPDEPLLLTSFSNNAETTGPCSARALIDTPFGVATLDPACARVRFIALDSGIERFFYSIPDGDIGRAFSAVPDTQAQQLTLGSVDTSGTVRLRVISLPTP